MVAFALIVSIGGYWAFLQSIGWVGMILSYAQQDSVLVALEKTFNGQNPCRICQAVKEGKHAEKNNLLLKVETKLELWVIRRSAFFHPPLPLLALPAPLAAVPQLCETPPTPPPRQV